MHYRPFLVALFLALAALPVRAQGVIDPFTLFPAAGGGSFARVFTDSTTASTTSPQSVTISGASSGDLAIVWAISGDYAANSTLTPTGGGLSYTSQYSTHADGGSIDIWTATLSTGSEEITVTLTGGATEYQMGAFVFSNASGIGTVATVASGWAAQSVDITPTAGNSVIVMTAGRFISAPFTWTTNTGTRTIVVNDDLNGTVTSGCTVWDGVAGGTDTFGGTDSATTSTAGFEVQSN